MVTSAHARRFIGQHVAIHTTGGQMHHGILHSVTDDGIYVRSISGGPRFASDSSKNAELNLLENATKSESDAEEAFWPFLFFPFFALALLGPWGWGW